LPYRPYL